MAESYDAREEAAAEGYTLYVPFMLPASRDVKDLPHSSTIASREARLADAAPNVAVTVVGIPSRDKALELLDHLSDGLHWAALETGVGLTFSGSLDEGYRPEDPEKSANNLHESLGLRRKRVDLIVDGNRPYVARDGDSVLAIKIQPVTLRLSYSPDSFVRAIDAGVNVVRSFGPPSDRLRRACKAYSQTHFDFSRFIALFIPLEIAAPDDSPPHEVVRAQVYRWQNELRSLIGSYPANDPVRAELQGLASRLGQLAKQSHTGRIKNFVRDKLSKAGHEDADTLAETIGRLYSKRGDLTHEGAMDVSKDLSDLEQIVRKTLMAAWSEQSSD